MAWRARVMNIVRGNTELSSLVEIGFYDDADPVNAPLPTVFLHRKSYVSEHLTSLPEFVAMLEAEGAAARTAYERVQAVRAGLPIGAEIGIP